MVIFLPPPRRARLRKLLDEYLEAHAAAVAWDEFSDVDDDDDSAELRRLKKAAERINDWIEKTFSNPSPSMIAYDDESLGFFGAPLLALLEPNQWLPEWPWEDAELFTTTTETVSGLLYEGANDSALELLEQMTTRGLPPAGPELQELLTQVSKLHEGLCSL